MDAQKIPSTCLPLDGLSAGGGNVKSKFCTIAGMSIRLIRMLLLMNLLPSLRMMRWTRHAQIWPEGTQISASPSGKDLVTDIREPIVRDLLLISKRWKMKFRAQDMGVKRWVTYSFWTQISASPCGGGVLLDVEGWLTREQVLESARREKPEDSVTRWMDGYDLPLDSI